LNPDPAAMNMENVDEKTVEGFGDEWSRFDYQNDDGLQVHFNEYFGVFPWDTLPVGAQGFDAGCGSGRWARLVAPRVGVLHCVDASPAALDVARRNLRQFDNVRLHHATIADMPIPDGSMDFGYSLGVLHHMPDTASAIVRCVQKLKPGAPFLVYLYYALDNRPAWFRAIWKASDVVRDVISRAPFPVRNALSQAIAASVYWPMARSTKMLERLGLDVDALPLSAYRDRSFYMMRNDALDRFGTRLEQRFTRREIEAMMVAAGLEEISFHEGAPYWCAVGRRRR
jgi:SAM-dependent methyltransferase